MTDQTHEADLEIYILKPDTDAIAHWLTKELGPLDEFSSDSEFQRWTFQGCLIVLTRKADGNFGSLWFKQNRTHWSSDLECARSAHSALNTEIRCAATGWSEQQSSLSPDWIKLTRGQEKPFHWN
jgi:hypothetical protein